MQRLVTKLKGYSIGAKDGDIGSVDDFLFDDKLWTIRYLVADTAKWLPGKRVVISPIALGHVESNEQRLTVSLTKQQVENSPDVDSRNFSREHETSYYDYYGWPYYWVGGDVWGTGTFPGELATENGLAMAARDQQAEADNTHLRSAREVMGYYIEATDGDIGHVEDFVLDDETWEIRYMVIDTKNWWPGKKVLVSPEWIDRVSWSDSRVYVDLSREAIKSGPEFDPDRLNRDYEERLYKHYDRPGYWVL
jgi:sporulation protein YlmC with PRC-barrel domain